MQLRCKLADETNVEHRTRGSENPRPAVGCGHDVFKGARETVPAAVIEQTPALPCKQRERQMLTTLGDQIPRSFAGERQDHGQARRKDELHGDGDDERWKRPARAAGKAHCADRGGASGGERLPRQDASQIERAYEGMVGAENLGRRRGFFEGMTQVRSGPPQACAVTMSTHGPALPGAPSLARRPKPRWTRRPTSRIASTSRGEGASSGELEAVSMSAPRQSTPPTRLPGTPEPSLARAEAPRGRGGAVAGRHLGSTLGVAVQKLVRFIRTLLGGWAYGACGVRIFDRLREDRGFAGRTDFTHPTGLSAGANFCVLLVGLVATSHDRSQEQLSQRADQGDEDEGCQGDQQIDEGVGEPRRPHRVEGCDSPASGESDGVAAVPSVEIKEPVGVGGAAATEVCEHELGLWAAVPDNSLALERRVRRAAKVACDECARANA